MNSHANCRFFAITERGTIWQAMIHPSHCESSRVEVVDPGQDPSIATGYGLPQGPYLAVTKDNGIFFYRSTGRLASSPPRPQECTHLWLQKTLPVVGLCRDWYIATDCQKAVLENTADITNPPWAESTARAVEKLAGLPYIFLARQEWPAFPVGVTLPVLT